MTAGTDALRPIRNPNARRRRTPIGRWFHYNERLALGLVGLVGFILFWEIGSRVGFVDAFFFSKPSSVGAATAPGTLAKTV